MGVRKHTLSRDGCEDNLSHLTREDVPKVSEAEEWRHLELSEEYHLLCEEAKKMSLAMDSSKLKALEETEDRDAIQNVIEGLQKW